ncbi:kinase-like domain-containing protein [Phlebopus sp. FC_14]|nr:kinase-like domain-containing protein [Phlebopus sp. FC_14]
MDKLDKWSEPEREWCRDYDYLKQRGYTLRSRYSDGWTPSADLWSEDMIPQKNPYCLDATRANGTRVYIKKVFRNEHPAEAEIAQFLSLPAMLSDSHNHTVPVLDCFAGEKGPEIRYLVMPLLRPFNQPPFTTIKECVDFVDQTLEGLVFMHQHNVAHRDCSAQNIMMDGYDLYPNGWHPMSPWLTPDGKAFVTPRKNRCDVNIRYFFIDFGLSTHFAPGEKHEVVGRKCSISTPELSDEKKYNPFRLDVYLLGNVFYEHICNAYVDIPFLEPLMRAMTAFEPEDRPTSKEALQRWQDVCKSKEASSMRGWLHSQEETGPERLARDLASSAIYAITRLRS